MRRGNDVFHAVIGVAPLKPDSVRIVLQAPSVSSTLSSAWPH